VVSIVSLLSRDMSSEASSPGSDAPCRERRAGRGADTPAIFIVRVGTVTTGTALQRIYLPQYLKLNVMGTLTRAKTSAPTKRFPKLYDTGTKRLYLYSTKHGAG
jgi:hypothetical protein